MTVDCKKKDKTLTDKERIECLTKENKGKDTAITVLAIFITILVITTCVLGFFAFRHKEEAITDSKILMDKTRASIYDGRKRAARIIDPDRGHVNNDTSLFVEPQLNSYADYKGN